MALAAWSSAGGAQSLHAREPAILYYISFPLASRREGAAKPVFGLAIHGRHAPEAVRLDSRLFRLAGSEAIELKWVLVGAVAAGAALAAAGTAAAKPQGPPADSQAPTGACRARPTC